MSIKRYRYIGEYGKRQRGGFVPNIAVLFHGDEVLHDLETGQLKFVRPNMPPIEATEAALAVLRGDEFTSEVTCEHRFANGESCLKKPADGKPFCSFHEKVHAKKPVPQLDAVPDTPPAVVENAGPGENPAVNP